MKWKFLPINDSILFFCFRNNNDRQNNKICTPYSKMTGILLSYNTMLIGPQGTGVIVFFISTDAIEAPTAN